MEVNSLIAQIGDSLIIHGVKHIVLAATGDDLLLLQMKDGGEPCQYVVAHGAYMVDSEMVWLDGDYFPLPMYSDTAAALKDAVDNLIGGETDAISRQRNGSERSR